MDTVAHAGDPPSTSPKRVSPAAELVVPVETSLDEPPPRMAAALSQRAAKDQSRLADPGDRLPSPRNPTRGTRQVHPSQAEELAKMFRTTGRVAPDLGLSLKPGARLVREWHGRTHTVTVTEDGFEYAGINYPSLTKVAQRITGAHWSGPRFFGLVRTGVQHAGSGDDNG